MEIEIQQKIMADKELQKDPMYIPPEIQPLGMVYSWIRYSIDGCIDYQNLKRMSKMGFRPVLSDRHPDIENDGRVPFMISRGGSVIMERTERAQKTYQDRIDFVSGIMAHPAILSTKMPESKVLATENQLSNQVNPFQEAMKIGAVISGLDREAYIENLSTISKEKVVN